MRDLAAGGVGEEGLLQAAALATVVEIGESEDVVTRDRPHYNNTGLCRAQIWRSGTHARKKFKIWAHKKCDISSTPQKAAPFMF